MIEAWKLFLDQAEAERKEQGLTKSALSYVAFDHGSCYREILTGERSRRSIVTAHRIAEGLGLKLVICMVDKDE